MTTLIKTITDALGNIILPRTRAEAVTLEDGVTTIQDVVDTADAHYANTSNPHSTTAVQVGADPTGTASIAVSNHVAASDPHTQYLKENPTASEVGALPMPDAGNYFPGDDTLGTQMQSVGSQLAQIMSQADILGIRFSKSPVTDPAGTRLYSAVGLTATAGVDAAGTSDFDKFPVYRLRLCNRVSGAVTAYYGEPGFLATNDTFVEIPKGYYRVYEDASYTYHIISDKPFQNGKVHPAFRHWGKEQDYIYLAAYKSSYDGASKHESKSGTLPDVSISRTTSRTRSQARGSTFACMQDIQARDWLNLLYMVEFATRSSQTAIGRGLVDMPYSATHVATVAESSVNRIIIANAFADLFVVGQEISIGTSAGANGVAADRTVTSIDVYDASNKAITFSGAAVNIALGNIVWTSRQKNGKTDSIAQGTGRATGTDGKTSIRYRGIENPWGNVWEWVDNLNIRNNQGYLDTLGRIASYSDTDFGTLYSPLSAAFPAANNYMVNPLICSTTGLSCLPATVGGSTNQYYCDYYYQSSGDRAAFVGGNWSNGSGAGLWYWPLDDAASYADISFGARLLEIPL